MEIRYSRQAVKFLSHQPEQFRKRIVHAIERLPAGDVKKLQGTEGYRLRVGDYRVLFDISGTILAVEKIDSRGQVYKGG